MCNYNSLKTVKLFPILLLIFVSSCNQKNDKNELQVISAIDSPLIKNNQLDSVIDRAMKGNIKSYDSLSSYFLDYNFDPSKLLPIAKHVSNNFEYYLASHDAYICIRHLHDFDSVQCDLKKEAIMYFMESKIQGDVSLWSLIEEDELIAFENGSLIVKECSDSITD